MPDDIAGVIGSFLDRDPGDKAIRFHGKWFDRGWLRDLVTRLHASIDAMGLERGVPIGLAPHNRPEFIASLLALLQRGHPIVMIYAYQSGEAIARKLAELNLPLVIAARDQWSGPMEAAARKIGTGAIGVATDAPEITTLAPWSPAPGFAHRRAPEEPGIELLSSGTTGPPKHFALSYERLFSRMVLNNSMKSADRIPTLLYFPLGNISGMYTLIPVIAADNPMILLEKFAVPDWVEHVKATKPTMANLPPAAFRMVLDAGVDPADLAGVRYVTTGAATLDPTLRREFEARFGLATLQSYGATEFGGVVTAMTPDHIAAFGDAKSDSVGRPWGGAGLRITDIATGAELPAGREGRIEVHAPAMSPDWISTTDLGLLDEDGFLYHRGRLDGAIVRGGFKIIPEAVAEALLTHPAVASAAVVGIDDERLGAVPAVAVQLREDQPAVTVEELQLHLRDMLPSPSVPKHYKIVEALPRTPSLKVDLVAVKALFA